MTHRCHKPSESRYAPSESAAAQAKGHGAGGEARTTPSISDSVAFSLVGLALTFVKFISSSTFNMTFPTMDYGIVAIYHLLVAHNGIFFPQGSSKRVQQECVARASCKGVLRQNMCNIYVYVYKYFGGTLVLFSGTCVLACMTFILATEVGQTTHLDRMEENRPFWHSLFCTRYTFCVLAPNMTQFTYPVFSVQSHACSRPASTGTRHLHVDKLSIHRLEIIVMRGTRAHGVGRWVAQPKERQSGRNAKNIRPRSKHTGKRQRTARHRHVQALSGPEVLGGKPGRFRTVRKSTLHHFASSNYWRGLVPARNKKRGRRPGFELHLCVLTLYSPGRQSTCAFRWY